ncbi:MAG: ExeM/NucH family extracellular endonuclease, partial [Nitrospirota bacterium]
IDGWTIQDNDFDGHVIANGGPLIIPPGGYLILGNNGDSGTNGGVAVDYSYGTSFFLANGADEVVLLDDTMAEIDRVEWDGGPSFPDPTGASMALADPGLDNNVGANWCEASTTFGFGDLGTPGAENDCAAAPAGPGDVVINEIMQNPSAVADSAGEWFELVNTTDRDFDLNGWTIQDNDSDAHVIVNGGPLVIPAGGYLVLGNNGDSGTNGGVAVDYVYGSLFLANGADEVVLLDDVLTEIDRVEWDGGVTFPDPTGASMALADPALDNNVGANWCEASTTFGAGDLGTPGAANDCGAGPGPIGACGDPATPIHDIQGAGLASPLDGTPGVVIEGVVVGDFQGTAAGLGGYFVQEEGGDTDSDPLTSEGIFVFDSSFGVDVSVGDVVRVQGDVDEFFDQTELTNVSNVVVCGSGATTLPATVTLPVASRDDLEPYEGMSVIFPQTLVVTDNFNLGRFGEVDLAVGDRLLAPTSLDAPGGPALSIQDLNDRSRIRMDDGSNVQNPLPLPPYLGADDTLRAGDTLPGLIGVLDYRFGVYRVQPTESVIFTRANPRLISPPAVGGSLTVASFDVLNYFSTIDTGAPICGPAADLLCRGADSSTELDRQRDKLVAAFVAMDADVVGLVSLENNANAVLDDLTGGINAVMGAGTYGYVDTGTIGADAIKVGFIYKPATVTPVGPYAVLDSTVDPSFLDDIGKNRPSLAQTFQQNATGGTVTIAVNHLKSKGGSCDDVGDPDLGDGQEACNGTRTAAATALVNWLATDPTGSGDPDVIIIGDLNSYAQEDPIAAITGAGYTDLIQTFVGPDAYTFVLDGQLGYLDYALANSSLTPQVTGVTEWHINADEPRALDYNEEFNQPDLYSADAFRSSNHDPVIVGLDLEVAVLVGDVDGDGNVDIDDVQAILAGRNTPAAGPDDPRDLDGDGIITVLDARLCILQCTNARCAP